MNLESILRRFEQQLAAFEQLHADEISRLEKKLAAYRRLHGAEAKMLKDELEELKKELAAREESGPSSFTARSRSQTRSPGGDTAQSEVTLTRREFLGGDGRRQTRND